MDNEQPSESSPRKRQKLDYKESSTSSSDSGDKIPYGGRHGQDHYLGGSFETYSHDQNEARIMIEPNESEEAVDVVISDDDLHGDVTQSEQMNQLPSGEPLNEIEAFDHNEDSEQSLQLNDTLNKSDIQDSTISSTDSLYEEEKSKLKANTEKQKTKAKLDAKIEINNSEAKREATEAKLKAELKAALKATEDKLKAELKATEDKLKAERKATEDKLKAELKDKLKATEDKLKAEHKAELKATEDKFKTELKTELKATEDKLEAERITKRNTTEYKLEVAKNESNAEIMKVNTNLEWCLDVIGIEAKRAEEQLDIDKKRKKKKRRNENLGMNKTI